MMNSMIKMFANAIKRMALATSVVAVVATSSAVLLPANTANAADFLGIPAWYDGLTDSSGNIDLQGKEIGTVVIIVALNITDIVLRLAGIVAVGFVIWGGIQYILARGEPNGVANGKKTLTHAIIGLVIAIASSAIVGFVSGRLS